MKSGIETGDSGLGCYAMTPTDYDEFKPFLDKVVREYHKVPAGQNHTSNGDIKSVKGVPGDGKLDISKLKLPAVSIRMRVGRNLQEFPLPGFYSLVQHIVT